MKKTLIYLSQMLLALVALTACNGEYAQPPMILPEGGLGEGTADSPKSALQVLNGSSSGETAWVTGYIVGWIDTSNSNAFDEQTATFSVPATVGTNLLLAYTPDETNYERCIPVQLPYGDIRDALSLVAHPENLGKQVTIKGTLNSYFSVNGVKNLSEYAWGDKGIPEAPIEYTKFRRVTKIQSGGEYAFVASGNLAAVNITANYGYLNVVETEGTGDEIGIQADVCTFIITAEDEGYTIQQGSDNRFLYMTGTYNNFNVGASAGANALFLITFDEQGLATITNIQTEKWLQYDAAHTSFGAYAAQQGVLPAIYQKVE